MMSQAVTWLFLSAHFLSPYDFTDRFNVLDYKIDDAAYCSNNNNEIHHGLHPQKSDGHCIRAGDSTLLKVWGQISIRMRIYEKRQPYVDSLFSQLSIDSLISSLRI